MELDSSELPEDLSQFISRISQDAVAQGAFGDVWKCHLCLNTMNVDVAVKVLRILPHDEDGQRDIRREMGIWRRIRHRHIVPFFGVANTFVPSRISLVSSWQANNTLTSLLELNNMLYRRRLLLLQDIASGLDYLHSVQVVHGDLTGSNVLIDADGRARLTDFGLSSVVNAGEGMTYLAITTRRPGAVRWVAPELVVEDTPHISPTFWSDIYSYGSVMLQTLSGQLPWSEINNPTTIIIKLYEKCLPQRPELLPMLDAHWDFIMLCMNLVAESRPSAAEVLEWVNKTISSWGNSAGPGRENLPFSSRMALNNYLQARFGTDMRGRVRWELIVTGPQEAPVWCATIYVEDMVYGIGEGYSKGIAQDRAANRALNRLRR